MQNNYEVLEIFPTPVYTTMLPQNLSYVIQFLDKQDMGEDDDGVDSANYGFRSKDSYILDKPECSIISSFILEQATNFGNMLGFDYESYRFGQSWISVKIPGQHHSAHTHPNSLISGCFYYGKNEEKTPAIKFHKPTLGVNVSYISPKMKDKKKDLKYAHSEFSIDFTPGLMILFPSYFMHSVPINKSNSPRNSLAFNIVPTVGFGDERNLTELKF
jgi:uncharacterized protein (TIGR02466 family)